MTAPTPTPKAAFLGGQPNDLMKFVSGYFDNYLGKSDAGSVLVTEGGVRLPNRPCKFVLLSNWNTEHDANLNFKTLSGDGLYENSGDEIYYGFNGIYVAQLFPSQNSGLLPVSNTDQICLRSHPSQSTQVWYAWFW